MGLPMSTDFLEKKSRALVLTNLQKNGGVLALATPDLFDLLENNLLVLEDIISGLDLLELDILKERMKNLGLEKKERVKTKKSYPYN